VSELAHVDSHLKAMMIDITGKTPTRRMAEARCEVNTTASVFENPGHPEKSVALDRVRVAGLQASTLTSSLIPLCHPLWIDHIKLALLTRPRGDMISAIAGATGRTQVEMEALTGCAVAALTLVSDLLTVDPEAAITDLTLWQQSGGRSGSWLRPSTESVCKTVVAENIECAARGACPYQSSCSVSPEGSRPSG
jgi:cyclic pyranopterin phosphate synthase